MEKRNAYLEKFEAKLNQYNANIAEIKAKIDEVQSDMKLEYLSQVDNLEKKRDDFMVKYGQLKETSGHAWEDLKIGTEKAWDELEDSIKTAVSRFK